MRGNPFNATFQKPHYRSIPACAGEPVVCDRRNNPLRVYPRVCGGTRSSTSCLRVFDGLSPRVRGNRGITLSITIDRRSIPACAGEPRPGIRRVAGIEHRSIPACAGGTSYHPQSGSGVNRGSIPACAGEPVADAPNRKANSVYPRVCEVNLLIMSPTKARSRSIPACAGEPHYGAPSAGDAHGLSPRVRGNLREVLPTHLLEGSIPACAGEPSECRPDRPQRRVYPRVCRGTIGTLRKRFKRKGLSPRVRGNR